MSAERKAELCNDFRRNDPRDIRLSLREYLRWMKRDDRRALRLCQTGLATWIVHAEKGDGGLTGAERRALEACPLTHVITIPGAAFLLPNVAAERITAVIVDAAACIG